MTAVSVVGLSALLFVLGVVGFFVKRDLLTQFMSVEIMLNAANLAILGLSRGADRLQAQAIVFFVLTVAAAEAAVGLAIILQIVRQRGLVHIDRINLLKG